MITLETDRLVIRNFKSGDWRDLREMIVKYQASDVAIYDHKWPTDAEEIKSVAEWFAGGDRFLAVCLKTTGKLIGFISLHPKEDEKVNVYSLGYVFNIDYHGQGYATESCRAVLDYAFGTLAADSVVTGTAEANAPSCRLLRRLGFTETGDRHTGSFHETLEGDPIEFTGLSFAMSREAWMVLGQATA